MRIVSLLPSATEIAVALGLTGSLVARSHECDYPPEILRLPACTAREIELTESTPGIQVRSTAPNYRALSAFTVDWDLLRGLRPTHILTQTLCKSCAVTMEEVRGVLQQELFDAPGLLNFEARSLSGVLAEMRHAAEILGIPEQGDALVDSLESRTREIQAAVEQSHSRPPVVACLEWLKPVMLGGNWLPELVRFAGGIPAGGNQGVHSSWTDKDALRKLDPDVIIAMPCGYRVSRTAKEMRWLTGWAGFQDLKAVRSGQVYIADGSSYFNRPGPRLIESIEILAEILAPTAFPPKHEGTGWQKFSVA